MQSVSVSKSLKSAEPFGTVLELKMGFFHMIIGKGDILLSFFVFVLCLLLFVLYIASRRCLRVVKNCPKQIFFSTFACQVNTAAIWHSS